MRKQLLVVALAATLVLAGCSSAVSPTASPSAAADATPTEGTQAMTSGSGTVNFYVSDEKNAIGDFQSLNVTVDAVSFKRVDADDDDGEEADVEAENSEEPEETEEPEAEAQSDDENATATPTVTAANETAEANETADPTETPESETEAESEADEEEDDSEDGWITRDVNETTVDLTELQGENATQLSRADLPNGTYTQVRIHITAVNGTLTDGTQVNVKLPSNKLKLNSEFTIGDGEEVDFVYDATVFEAGNSGKYILKPVASESGTNVPIKSVDRDDEGENDIGARFVGQVERGSAATVKVTQRGGPVMGATVEVGDEEYQTGSDGTVMFDVPSDAEELEIEIEYEDSEAELKRKFGGQKTDDESEMAENSEDAGTEEPDTEEPETEEPETEEPEDDESDRKSNVNENADRSDDETATPEPTATPTEA